MSEAADRNLNEYVTALIGGQLFGLPILRGAPPGCGTAPGRGRRQALPALLSLLH